MENSSLTAPDRLSGTEYRYDSFGDGRVLLNKKKGHLPAMGWNSWNAFGSGNTEELTRRMADRFLELGLDRLGYRYLVLDDGCYLKERVGGRLSNEPVKFPSGFKALADYIHARGLSFGMYNDIGTNLCAGAAVGTCGHEREDALSYAEWDVDFLKVDNCYYLWDNATFSAAGNAKYTYAPAIAGVTLEGPGKTLVRCSVSPVSSPDGNSASPSGLSGRTGTSSLQSVHASDGTQPAHTSDDAQSVHASDGALPLCVSGRGVRTELIDGRPYYTNIGTFDGTGPGPSPVGPESGEIYFDFEAPAEGIYTMTLDLLCGEEPGRGSWLQAAVEKISSGMAGDRKSCGSLSGASQTIYDDLTDGDPISFRLDRGRYRIRLMNHRRQENTLCSYAKLLEGLKEACPKRDIIYSLCEWGKTQPQNWGYKVGDSWRILNDITFDVGADGRHGSCAWKSDYTNSVTSQYNKCVIMDEFAGPDRGWNDPDMMVLGMDGLNMTQYRTHMAMWCMMNSPLMLGLDLRRIEKGDELCAIIANKELIALNQDPLGVQAKRIYTSALDGADMSGPDRADSDMCRPDRAYITMIDRLDILAKPLADGSVALSFINVSDSLTSAPCSVTVNDILSAIGHKMPAGAAQAFRKAAFHRVADLWTGEETTVTDNTFGTKELSPCDNHTIRIF